ncbi:MAG: HEAT repeat domain-containing protein, partial [Fimbriimonadales bacterium]|nr:HEAT repeat domain-containing protein [Fimbriimonadales bacterium]
QTQSLANAKLLASETTTVRFLWRETRRVDAARLQAWRTRYRPLAAKPESLRIPDRAPTVAQQRLADQQALGNETLESLQRKLAQLPPDAPFEQVAALMPPWTALVRLQPELSGRLMLQIAASDIRSPQAQVLLTALREAGHAPAQAALTQLARLYRHRGDADAYALLMPNFALIENPTEPTEVALQELAQADNSAFANPARLALGSVGYRLRETEPTRTRRLGAWMTRQLERSTNDSEREVWLLALGNLGLNDTLPTIQAYLNAPNESIRAAATGALRFLTLPGVESLLLERLRTDESRLVKQEAISAFQYRTPSNAALQSLRRYLEQEPDKDLRRALLDALHTHASKAPSVMELLRWAAQNDPDRETRLYAESLIVSLKKD